MARDSGLEQLIRDEFAGLSGLSERSMFGGWTLMLNGNLLCGARDDGMLVRLGKGNDAWALELPGVVQMLSGSRTMQGWVRAGPAVYGDDALRQKLLSAALSYVRSLPAK